FFSLNRRARRFCELEIDCGDAQFLKVANVFLTLLEQSRKFVRLGLRGHRVLGCLSRTISSRMRCAVSSLDILGSSTGSGVSREMIVTAFMSLSKPMSLRLTSFATTASRFLDLSLLDALAITSLVSAANPTMRSPFVRADATSARMSCVRSRLRLSDGSDFLIFLAAGCAGR